MSQIDDLEALKLLIEENPAPLALVDPETMAYVVLNEAMARSFGYTREQLWAAGPLLLGGDVEAIRQCYRDVIDAHPGHLRITGPLRCADGVELEFERLQRAMRVGGRWLIAVSGIDRAEKKHAHEGIERLRAVIEQANEGMAVVDFETMQYVEINDACAHIYGRTRDEMMAMGPAQARASVGLPSSDLREIYQEVIRTSPRVHMYEGWFPRPDGTLFYMQTARQAVRIGEQWLIVLNTRDLTTEKLAQAELERSVQELRRSNKELEQFAYAASHDLSEPLRMIAGYTDLLHRRYGALLDDSGREFMGFILSGAQRMRQLIDDLLTYSRAGRGVREFRPVPLDALMRDVTDNLRRVIEDKGAAVEAGPLPEVMADRSLLTQLMQNLVSNATKFVEGRAPLVQVTCVREGEWWKVSVRDNGIGIASKDFERIFVIFQRLNARDRYEGTGIGLALCKKIVETHRGQIWVESTPGEGSAFHFTLPVAPRIGPAPA